MADKTAAHRLLLRTRSNVADVIRELHASDEIPKETVEALADAWIVLFDVLELQIRRIDELEQK